MAGMGDLLYDVRNVGGCGACCPIHSGAVDWSWKMRRRPTILAHGVAVLVFLLALVVGLLAAPATAFAREYSIPRVRIYATLQADGTLEVTEDRTYDFIGEYHGVYWDLSRDGGEGSDLAIAVRSCGIVSGSDYSTFEQNDSNSDGTYTVSDTANDNGTPVTRVTLYSTNEDTWIIFRIVYTVTGVATRYSDVGELYWKFVSDGWEVPSENVVCTVDLPAPLVETISVGDNVRVWAHGPLSGTITTGGRSRASNGAFGLLGRVCRVSRDHAVLLAFGHGRR